MKNKQIVRKHYIIPDKVWDEIESLIPKHKTRHPLGCHRPRISNRSAMNGIFFVLKTGCQWNALNETGICTSSSAHRRFQEWTKDGTFKRIWEHCLQRYDAIKGIDWSFCSTDGTMTKAPLGGEKNREKPYRQSENRNKTISHH